MSELARFQSSDLLPSDVRRTGRAISRLQSRSQVRLSSIEAQVEESITKADGYTAASGSASADVVRLAQLQKQLELVAPEASGRLALIAEDHAFAMVDILGDLRRDLRRR